MASAPAIDGRMSFSDASGERRHSGVAPVALSDACADSFRAEWLGLTENCSEPNPFFEPWFLTASLENLGSNKRIELLACRAANALSGLVPVARSMSYYGKPVPHLASWLHTNVFCGNPLVRRGHEKQFWHAYFEWADRNAGAALFLHLPMLSADGPLFAGLRAALAEESRPAAIVEREERALLATSLSKDAYLDQSMSAKKRKEIRRQRKRLGELGELQFVLKAGTEDLDTWTEQFLELENRGWKGTGGSAMAKNRDMRGLFASVLKGAAEAGRLQRLALELDRRPIAMLVNFLTPPGAFAFKTAFDEDFARYSPGVLLQIENLALLERGEIQWADSCAAEGHPMIERIWRERRELLGVNVAIGGALKRKATSILMRLEARHVQQGLGHGR